MDEPDTLLTIGELARRTGVQAATLRMWETRHGFPVPERLDSGHRRYPEADVRIVRQVISHRDAGARLEAAIAAAITEAAPSAPSVYAVLRRRHPRLAPQRLRKSTLTALSWAIEDEFCVRADRGRIFGGFQLERYYDSARPRWREIDRIAELAVVFAELEGPARPDDGPLLVALPPDAPMRREWFVVSDSPTLPVVLTAWELPGQDDVPDRDRLFESVWAADPAATRDASRVCAGIAHEQDMPGAGRLVESLAGPRGAAGLVELASVNALFSRMMSYVDRRS